LILGASSGMGEATAITLAKAGYKIAGIHLDFRAALAHVEEVKAAIEELQWVEYAARTNRMRVGIAAPTALPHPVSSNEVLARILVAHGGEHVEERPLRIGRVIIGRTVDNDVQIDSKYVSRHHCQITTTPEGSILEDLNSTNGVYVKSKRVRRHHLNDGDVVVLARQQLGGALHDRHLRAEAPVHLRELEADVAAADHDQVPRHEVDLHDRLVGQKGHLVQARHLRHQRPAAYVEEDLRSSKNLAFNFY